MTGREAARLPVDDHPIAMVEGAWVHAEKSEVPMSDYLLFASAFWVSQSKPTLTSALHEPSG